MLKTFNTCVAVLLCFSLTGCATIISGRSQNVMVATDPSEANVTINNNTQKSPATFNLNKSPGSYTIRIAKEGFKTEEVDLKSSLGGWVFCNAFFGLIGIIGVVTDLGSGSAYRFSPNKINKTLTPGNDSLTPVSNVVTPTIKTQAASKCAGVVGGPEWTACMGLK